MAVKYDDTIPLKYLTQQENTVLLYVSTFLVPELPLIKKQKFPCVVPHRPTGTQVISSKEPLHQPPHGFALFGTWHRPTLENPGSNPALLADTCCLHEACLGQNQSN